MFDPNIGFLNFALRETFWCFSVSFFLLVFSILVCYRYFTGINNWWMETTVVWRSSCWDIECYWSMTTAVHHRHCNRLLLLLIRICLMRRDVDFSFSPRGGGVTGYVYFQFATIKQVGKPSYLWLIYWRFKGCLPSAINKQVSQTDGG